MVVMPNSRCIFFSSLRSCTRSLASRLDSGSSMQMMRGPGDEGAGDGHALLLTAGQLTRPPF